MARVTADTNVIVSGLNFPGSKPNRLLELARAGEVELVVSDAILDETADVLARKFDWPPEDIAEIMRQFGLFARHFRPSERLNVVKDDPDDNAIIECAVASGSHYIVTGDKDILRLKRYNGIRIVSVADFLELVRAEGQER